MKRTLLLLIVLLLCLSVFSGCETPNADTGLPPFDPPTSEGVSSVSVSSLPEGYNYSFTGEAAKKVVDYFSEVQLTSEYDDNPNEMTGMTLVVSITYQDGSTEILYEFSPFIRKDGGSWYKIVQNDASNFHTFLNELKNEYCLTLTDFDMYCTVSTISSVYPKTIKLSKTDNTCHFGYGIESNDERFGTYELTDTTLTLTLEQGHVYTFNVIGEDLVFDADKSTSPVVEDGTLFKRVKQSTPDINGNPNDIVDTEVPDVLVKIEKWVENKFEGVVANPLISYLEVGDKVSVVFNDQTMASDTKYPVGTLVIVRFGSFDADVQPNILYAEAVECGQMYGNGIRMYDYYHPDDSERYPFFSVTIPTLNNADVKYSDKDYTVYIDGESLLTQSGFGCHSFYISDLTGDGYPELCFGTSMGSGIVDSRIEIIDYTTKTTIFALSDRMYHDYFLFLRDGVLCVKETEYMKHDAVRTGVLTYNGSEISVAWDSEVNAAVDRDNSPAPGESIRTRRAR